MPKPTDGTPDSDQPVAQHLHDETKRPLKVPASSVPPNLPKQFPGKSGKGHFGGQGHGGPRNFRHQGR